jgi:predicted metal-binding protein
VSQETCRRELNPNARREIRARSHVLTVDVRPDPGDPSAHTAPRAVTILVCASCRGEDGSDARPRPGERLGLATAQAAAGSGIEVRKVECLGNCKRRLSAALLADGCWSYVFGDLTADSAADLVAGARLFSTSTDGLLPWRGRPEPLKRGLVSRMPPMTDTEELT